MAVSSGATLTSPTITINGTGVLNNAGTVIALTRLTGVVLLLILVLWSLGGGATLLILQP